MKFLYFIVYAIPGICLASALSAQSGNLVSDSDEAKIIRNWKFIEFENNISPVVKIPQRKFDSPFFCDELIPYRNGFIINSIVTSPGGTVTDVRTIFYYFDMTTGTIYLLTIPGVDTIESVLPDRQGRLLCAYKSKRGNVIARFNGISEEILTTSASEQVKIDLDTAVWVKLGFYGEKLIALTEHAAYSFSENQFEQLVIVSLGEYFHKRKYRRSLFLLPTRNILVTDQCIWFLYEVVQGRTCNLMRLDLRTGKVTDFFKWIGYTDNYKKEIYDYAVLPGGFLLATSSRLMGNYMVLKAFDGNAEVWTFNNKTRSKEHGAEGGAAAPWGAEQDQNAVGISAIALAGDTVYFAGVNGLFKKNGDRITTLMRWNNTHQMIKGKIDFEFVPRSLQILPGNLFLVSGLFGGIYIADPANSSVRCLDDVTDKKINKVNLRSW